MAKVKLPLISEKATGKIGQSIIFRIKQGTKFVSKFFFPGSKTKYTPSTAQSSQRANYQTGAQAWSALSPAEKQVYIDTAQGQNLTGYNLFMQEYLSKNYLLLETGDLILQEDSFKIKL